MRLDPGWASNKVDDRRGVKFRGGAAIGGGAAVVALVLALLGAPQEIVQQVLQGGRQAGSQETQAVDPAQQPLYDRARTVFGYTERIWTVIFQQAGETYDAPRMTVFSEGTDESRCGTATSAVGPFYCPLDRRVFIDLTFFEQLDKRFGAPGDAAQAYVIAHEVGHHVQTLTGISEKVHAMRARVGQVDGNKLSVRQELQADCYAGLWAHHTEKIKPFLDPGDIDEALQAATAIGDDTLQKRSQGHVVPDSFTHGSSAQRVEWFRRGFEQGTLAACDTFKGTALAADL
jgi:hypothetical protein